MLQKTKKKIKRNITSGVVHVQSTFNNTIVTVTDLNGNTLSWASAGTAGFKGARKELHSLHKWQLKKLHYKLLNRDLKK